MQKKSFWKKITGSREASLVLVLIVLCVIISIMNPTFLSPMNLAQIFRNNALIMIMALGMLCVLLTGGIDISITSILAFSGMTVGMLLKYNVIHNTFLLFVIGTAIGIGCGALNGLIISRANVTPIICTMGFMYIWRGLAYVISNSAWASGEDVAGFSDFGKDGSIGPYIILALIYVIFFVMMKWTKFGRKIYAVGANAEAATISGIDVNKDPDLCLRHHGTAFRSLRRAFRIDLRIRTAQHAVRQGNGCHRGLRHRRCQHERRPRHGYRYLLRFADHGHHCQSTAADRH
jgi:rhamnose transport system permease protein